MSKHFFNTALQQADARIAGAKSSSRYLLDKNEQSDDVDMARKMEVLDHLLDAGWNRYPSADNYDIEADVAAYCGLQPENIVLSAGSANMITTLLNYFALNRKDIILTQPSYSLFEYHCKTYAIPYQAWKLPPELEYDCANMPVLDANSVLFITAPNNPVGNSISTETAEQIIRNHPESLIVVDAV